MTSIRSFRTILLALTAGALGAAGCLLTVGEVDCTECSASVDPDPLCHSEFNANTGMCECDDGYVFESSDPNDFECEREAPKPGTGDCGTDPNTSTNANGDCICINGTEWCSDDPDDLTCCNPVGGTDTDPTDPTVASSETEGTDTGIETDDTGGTDTVADSGSSSDTSQAELPPCTDEIDLEFACTNTGGPQSTEGSEQYQCVSGEWVLSDLDADCEFQNDDFSYGCYVNDDGVSTNFCGSGPGTDCTDAEDACSSETVLLSCLFGKLTEVDCENFCTGPQAEIQTDFGTCEAKSLDCCCFDEGQEGSCQ